MSAPARRDVAKPSTSRGRDTPANLTSSSERPLQRTTSTTELIVVTGDRYRVEGDARDVERIILDAARGSIMQLAWLIETETRHDLAINPQHVVVLRAAEP